MLTDDDWAEIWEEYRRWYERCHREGGTLNWVYEPARTQIAKLVDAKLDEKLRAEAFENQPRDAGP